MKKRKLKYILLIIIISVISLAFLFINRNYLLLEKPFKRFSNYISEKVVSKFYNEKEHCNVYQDKEILMDEINNLKDILNIDKGNNFVVNAKVTNHLSLILNNRFDINKGKKDNIKKNNLVITNKGLVGFIDRVSENYSSVNLVTNINNNIISVLITNGENNFMSVISSYNHNSNTFIIDNVIRRDNVSFEDFKVYLLGYNDIDHTKIYIGKVIKEDINDNKLTMRLEVKSDVDFNNLMYVSVIGD